MTVARHRRHSYRDIMSLNQLVSTGTQAGSMVSSTGPGMAARSDEVRVHRDLSHHRHWHDELRLSLRVIGRNSDRHVGRDGVCGVTLSTTIDFKSSEKNKFKNFKI